MKALHPEYNRFEIAAQIESQAARPGGPGWDERYGYGVINMSHAADAVDFNAWSLQVEQPSRGIAISGETPLTVDVNPRLVSRVQVQDEHGQTVATLLNSGGQYLLNGRFDANLLSPGSHTLSFTAYDRTLTALGRRSVGVSVRAANATGLQIKALDPLGRPTKAWISVFHPTTLQFMGQDMQVYEWVYSGETNEAGETHLSNDMLHDGNDFVLYANLSFATPDGTASAMYTRQVTSPGRVVLDGANAHPVKLTARRLAADGSVLPMDDGYIMGVAADAAGHGQGFPTNVISALESSGSATAWLEPGVYNLAAVSWTYNHYLYQQQVKVTPFTRRIDFSVDNVAQLTFTGDHGPYLFAGIALFGGSGMEPYLDVTKHHTITMTAGNYMAELVTLVQGPTNSYVYYLVDGLDPLVGGVQVGTYYAPGSRRTLHDGTMAEPITQNLRSYQVPATDYLAANKFSTNTNLWLYFGFWMSNSQAASLAQDMTSGPLMLEQLPGKAPVFHRLGVPGSTASSTVDVTSFGFFEPTFTVTGPDGTTVYQNTSWMNIWWNWWRIPSTQAPGLYRATTDLGDVGPLGGAQHTETAIDLRADGVSSGMRVTVIGPDGKASPAPWVEVLHKSVLADGSSRYDWVNWGFADAKGVIRFTADNTFMPDGGQYVVLAFHGQWDQSPPFLLQQTVNTPADVVIFARYDRRPEPHIWRIQPLQFQC